MPRCAAALSACLRAPWSSFRSACGLPLGRLKRQDPSAGEVREVKDSIPGLSASAPGTTVAVVGFNEFLSPHSLSVGGSFLLSAEVFADLLDIQHRRGRLALTLERTH